MNCLYILEIKPLLVPSFANIFSLSVGCLFILFVVSFAVKKCLNLIRSQFFVVVVISVVYIFVNLCFSMSHHQQLFVGCLKCPEPYEDTSLWFMQHISW